VRSFDYFLPVLDTPALSIGPIGGTEPHQSSQSSSVGSSLSSHSTAVSYYKKNIAASLEAEEHLVVLVKLDLFS